MNIKITPSKKTEFSKKILYVAALVNIAVIAFACYMIVKTENLEPLIYLIPSTAWRKWRQEQDFIIPKQKLKTR